jgi:hypothetical protein
MVQDATATSEVVVPGKAVMVPGVACNATTSNGVKHAPPAFVLNRAESNSDGGPSSRSHDTGDSMPGGAADPVAGAGAGAPVAPAAATATAAQQGVDGMLGCYRCRFSMVSAHVPVRRVHARLQRAWPCMRPQNAVCCHLRVMHAVLLGQQVALRVCMEFKSA